MGFIYLSTLIFLIIHFRKKIVKEKLSVQRIGKAEDLIDYINLINSSKNKFMNGSIVNIDGGMK